MIDTIIKQNNMWFPRMQEKVNEFLTRCSECMTRNIKSAPHPIRHFPSPKGPFTHLVMDFVDMITPIKGKRYMVVVSGVQALRPPSLHQRSPSPFLLDSIIITPHTCAPPHHIPSWSPSSGDYLDTSLRSLCLARLPALTCVRIGISHCVLVTDCIRFLCAQDTSTTLPFGVSSS